MTPYDIAYHDATPHGVLSAVHIPDQPDPVPQEALARLHPLEASHARTLKGYRQVQFVGGRIALRSAMEQVGLKATPVLPDDRGAPQMPPGLVASVSHKRTLAIAMVARDVDGTLGVDLEEYEPLRPSIAGHVLTASERESLAGLPERRHWIALLLRFSIKESIYKALDPWVRRYVGFHEAKVVPDLEGRAQVSLDLKGGEGPFKVDARYRWLHGRLITSVRILPD